MAKSPIHTTLDDPLSVVGYGRGENHHIEVRQYVHAGNKPDMDRKVCLVLDHDETLALATKLLMVLPVAMLRESDNLRKLDKILHYKLPMTVQIASRDSLLYKEVEVAYLQDGQPVLREAEIEAAKWLDCNTNEEPRHADSDSTHDPEATPGDG